MDVELQYREAKRAVIIADYLNVASRQRLPVTSYNIRYVNFAIWRSCCKLLVLRVLRGFVFCA